MWSWLNIFGRKAERSSAWLSTEEVLQQEANALLSAEQEPVSPGAKGVELNRKLNALDRSALCLSGGGIRSATFALGIIQALATFPRSTTGKAAEADKALLGKFHYISTVSGGGYIGSWLSAWLSRQTFATVQSHLAARPEGPSHEPDAIKNLRRDSNYLTPKIGLTSADTWTAAAMVVRNMSLVWLLVLSALAVVLVLLKLILALFSWWGGLGSTQEYFHLHLFFLSLGVALTVLGQRYSLTHYSDTDGGGVKRFALLDLACAVGGASLLTTWAIYPVGVERWTPDIWKMLALGPALFLTSGLLAFPAQCGQEHNPVLRFTRWCASGLVWSLMVLVGLYFLNEIDYAPARLLLLAVLGPPWLLMAQISAETVYVAATSAETRSDDQREWFARAAGWFVVAGVGWTLLSCLGLLGSRLTDLLRTEAYLLYQALVGGSLAAAAASVLFSADTKREDVVTRGARIRNVVQLAGGQIFLALVLVITSALIDTFVVGQSLLDVLLARARFVRESIPESETVLDTLLFGPVAETTLQPVPLFLRLVMGLLGISVIAFLASRHVNINRFSLHGLYRNRLVRAYLGATNPNRQPNPFTGFDDDDNPAMHELWSQTKLEDGGPTARRLFHVVNCTLNVVSTRDTAWQQRKAMSFAVTPFAAGAAALCPHPPGFRGAFQPSRTYGNKFGISLGTAMAISGAAANPNMGYNSAASITLLFALFNVRLGWWLANPGLPGRDVWDRSGPRQAIVPWFEEAFGLTTSDSAYVNLSDGGHFENLGLYEMVRRRCRVIVLSDAGCDPDFTFADLGNAIRKIYIDLGVAIVFPDLDQLKPRIAAGAIPNDGPYFTIGRIKYREADGGGEDGLILYVKPSYHGREGAGVTAYANESPTFPHESTADQWFSESQFESYRALGFEIMEQILSDLPPMTGSSDLFTIVKALEQSMLTAKVPKDGGMPAAAKRRAPIEKER